jgi:hypothetical protein
MSSVPTPISRLNFYREINLLLCLKHQNISRVVGVIKCDGDAGPVCVVLEHMPLGDLCQYLRAQSRGTNLGKRLSSVEQCASAADDARSCWSSGYASSSPMSAAESVLGARTGSLPQNSSTSSFLGGNKLWSRSSTGVSTGLQQMHKYVGLPFLNHLIGL